MHYGWPSPSLPKLLAEDFDFPVSNEEGSSIAILSLVGGIVGSLLSGILLDRLGRKPVILLTSPIYFISWILIANSSNIQMIFVARFIAGIADGFSFTATPMYLGEIANPDIRGFLCSSCVTVMILGMLLIQVTGSYFTIYMTAYFSSIIPILLLLTFIWMPESPYYLIMRGQTDVALANLKILRGCDDVEFEINRMILAVREQNSNKGKFLDLFTVKSNRKALFIAFGIRTVQQLSGITAFTFYANTIFNEAGEHFSAEVVSIIYFTMQLLVTTISSIILDKTGRRPLILLSVAGAAFALIVEGLYFYIHNITEIDTTPFELIPAVALIFFIVVFSLGLQTIPILMLGEIFPTNVKAFAISLADIYFSLIAGAVAKFFQFMKDDFGMHFPFFIFAGFCVLGLGFSYFYIPETKGKTLEDIQILMKGKPVNNDKRSSV